MIFGAFAWISTWPLFSSLSNPHIIIKKPFINPPLLNTKTFTIMFSLYELTKVPLLNIQCNTVTLTLWYNEATLLGKQPYFFFAWHRDFDFFGIVVPYSRPFWCCNATILSLLFWFDFNLTLTYKNLNLRTLFGNLTRLKKI